MAQSGAAHPETLADLTFSGSSGTECENFIRFVKRKAFSEQKNRDNEWMAYFASTCFTGAALRWFESLDDDTQDNWKLLSRALLEKYPATYGEDIAPINSTSTSSGGNISQPPAQTYPGQPLSASYTGNGYMPGAMGTTAQSTTAYPQGQPLSASHTGNGYMPGAMGTAAQSTTSYPQGQPLSASYTSNGYMPGAWLPMGTTAPPPPPKNPDPTSNITIPAAPPPRTNSNPFRQPPAAFPPASMPSRSSANIASLVNSIRKLNLTGTHRGRIAIRCDLSSEDGYIARKITKESSGLLFGFHVVTKSVIDALQVEFTQPSEKPPNSKPHIFKLLNSSAKGFEFLGLTWFERQPNYLGKGPGHTAYSHLTAVKGKESHELETSYENKDDGSYGDHDSDFNIVGKEIWRVSQTDGSISGWWSDYGGQLHELEFAVCLHDKEIYFVSDYGEFAKLYGPESYTRAKLAFELL